MYYCNKYVQKKAPILHICDSFSALVTAFYKLVNPARITHNVYGQWPSEADCRSNFIAMMFVAAKSFGAQ